MTHSCELSDYRIDRHLLGMESHEERHALQTHLQQCEACLNKVEHMRQQQQAYQVPKRLVRKLEKQYGPKSESIFQKWFWWPSLATATAAILLLVANPFKGKDHDGFGIKGPKPPSLWVALQRQGKIRLATSGERFFPKDKIRLAYRWKTKKECHVFILHRDAKRLTPLFPETRQEKSLRIQPNTRVELPGSFEMDDNKKGYEELLACFSQHPLTFQQVKRSLQPRTGKHTPPLLPKRTHVTPEAQSPCQFVLLFILKRGN